LEIKQEVKKDTGNSLPVFSAPVYKNKVLQQLSVNGQNVIFPWGVEFADSSAFYSLEDGIGYRYELVEHQVSIDSLSYKVNQIVRMREGLVRLKLEETLTSPRELRRICTLTCLEDTTLMDFVMRYRFQHSSFPMGYIGGRELLFTGSNIYHQYKVNVASVGNSDFSISVKIAEKSVPSCMTGKMYLRDCDNAWILHARMLPISWDKEVIKLCSKWFGTRPLPQWVSVPLLKILLIRKALWYRGERLPYRNWFISLFAPNAFPMLTLNKGEVLRWDIICRIEPSMTHKGTSQN